MMIFIAKNYNDVILGIVLAPDLSHAEAYFTGAGIGTDNITTVDPDQPKIMKLY